MAHNFVVVVVEEDVPWANICCQSSSFLFSPQSPSAWLYNIAVNHSDSSVWDAFTAWPDELCVGPCTASELANPRLPGHRRGVHKHDHSAMGWPAVGSFLISKSRTFALWVSWLCLRCYSSMVYLPLKRRLLNLEMNMSPNSKRDWNGSALHCLAHFGFPSGIAWEQSCLLSALQLLPWRCLPGGKEISLLRQILHFLWPWKTIISLYEKQLTLEWWGSRLIYSIRVTWPGRGCHSCQAFFSISPHWQGRLHLPSPAVFALGHWKPLHPHTCILNYTSHSRWTKSFGDSRLVLCFMFDCFLQNEAWNIPGDVL